MPETDGLEQEMRAREAIWLVARRELVERGRDRSFLISTVTVVVIVLAVVLMPRLLGFDGPTTYDVGVVDGTTALGEDVAAVAGVFDAEVELVPFADAAAAEAAAGEGDVHVALLPGPQAVTDSTIPGTLSAILQAAWQTRAQADAAADAGLDPAQAQQILQPPPLDIRVLDGEDRSETAGIAFIGMLVLYGQLFGYGMWVAMGIVEEKSTRVIEVLLSAIRPGHLLAGKILGIGALAFAQLLLIAGIGLGAVTVTGLIDLPPGTFPLLGQILLWFLLGFSFYACAFAMAGALVPRQEELQNAMTPVTMIVFVSFFASFAALNDPGGTIARVASLLPPSAPLAMPIRVALGQAATWEVIAAIALTVLAALALIPLAARVYRGAVLRTGSRVKLREALRSADDARAVG
jgi:ABC-2 type transport system permease protein